jgi:hypothetical protein
MKVCSAQYKDSKAIGWLDWYINSDETPAEQALEDETVTEL